MNALRNGWLKKTMVAFVIVALAITLFPFTGLRTMTKAAEGDVPVHGKEIQDNEDGTYTLSLSVTGDADDDVEVQGGVNVVVVYDVSQSMTNTVSTGGTRADNAEGVVYNFVHNLFGYKSKTDPTDTTIEMALVTFGAHAVQKQDWTNMEADITQYFDENVDDVLDGTVNLRYENGGGEQWHNGTNWQHALALALDYLDDIEDEDPTFVIFFTDGAPTAQGATANEGILPNGATLEQLRPYYEAALENAKSIQSTEGTTLYGIYAYGEEHDLLDDLMYYANEGSERTVSVETEAADNYFLASDTASLSAAIDSIFNDIVEALGISSAKISDGTTSNVDAESGTISHMLDVDEESYKYYLTFPANYKRTLVVDGKATAVSYTWEDNNDGTVTVSWLDNSLTLDGSVDDDGNFIYEWTVGNDFYDKPAPEAVLIKEGDNKGAVDWDLSDVGTLLSGVTYTVTFDVWPSQETLDLIADLKNGTVKYEDLDPKVQAVLDPDTYALETNTTATLSYEDTRNDDGVQIAGFENPDPASTTATELLAISKEWENLLDKQSSKPITLKVAADGEDRYEVVLSSDNGWKQNVYISVGIMTVDEKGNVSIKAHGHDFGFTEIESEGEHNWELGADVVHPMMVNGKLTMLTKVDEKPSGMADDEYYYSDGTDEYYRLVYTIDDENSIDAYYKAEEVATANLTATNYRRSNLNLTKEIEGEKADPDDLFTFKITVTDPDEEDFWFSIYDGSGLVANTDDADPEYIFNATQEEKDGSLTGYYYAESGTTVTVKMKEGWNLRVLNTKTGTEYEIEEVDLGNYELVEIAGKREYQEVDESGEAEWKEEELELTTEDTKVSGTIDITNSSYTITYTDESLIRTVTITKKWDDGSNQDGVRIAADEFAQYLTLKADGTEVTDVTPEVTDNEDDTYTITWSGLPKMAGEEEITYTVEESEIKEYTTTGSPASADGTITNTHKTETTDVTITKKWDDAEDQDGKRIAADKFAEKLTLKADGTAVKDKTPEITDNKDNTYTITWTDLPKNAKGSPINYTVEESAIDGYTTEGSPAKADGTITNKHTPETVDVTVTKEWDDKDDKDGLRPDSLTLTLKGLPDGVTAPEPSITKDGNKWTYTWKDLPKCDKGEEIAYTVSEDTVPEGYEVSGSPAKTDGTITNTHEVEVVYEPVKVDPPVQKVLETEPAGVTAPNIEGKFTFTIKGVSAKDEDGEDLDVEIPMPTNTSITNSAEFERSDMPGYYEFGWITFEVPGVYTYTVSESGTVDGIENDANSTQEIVFTVTDAGDGKLAFEKNYSDAIVFTNKYTAKEEVVTGDSRQIMPYVIGFGASAVVLIAVAVVLIERKKRVNK
ncbi:MAG: Cna B-type domain-containing protein [Lachnospiraceae bacterium]|nr:Cna B-type domain-containing protein [Lachnospiraceae bacterium]